MSIGTIVKVGTRQYIETDFALYNLAEFYKTKYGERPYVWRLFENNAAVVGVSANYYIISNYPPTNASTVLSIGNGDTASPFCVGNTSPTTTTGQTSTEVPKISYTTTGGGSSFGIRVPSSINFSQTAAKPDLRSQNRLLLAEGSPFVTVGTSLEDKRKNLSREEIIGLWTAFTYADAYNQSKVDDTQIYFHKPGVVGSTKIETLDQLMSAFPRYFFYDEEFKRQALASITKGYVNNEFYADNTWWPKDYLGLWDALGETFITESAIRDELKKKGYSDAEIRAIRALRGFTAYSAKNSANSPGSGAGTGGSKGSTGRGGQTGGTDSTGKPWLGPDGYSQGRIQEITIQRSRNLFLTADDTANILSASNVSFKPGQPEMYQIYVARNDTPGADAKLSPIVNRYRFQLAPNEISYSGLGGEWVTVERTGGFPMIDWKNFKLLQVSFSFVIAEKSTIGGLTADGLDLKVKDSIELLQRMAQTPYPVMFYGFDTLLTNQFRYDKSGTPRGIQFIIQDLTITATRRNANMEITRAQASITLQEIPVEKQSLIGMPRLVPSIVKPSEPTASTPADEYGLFSLVVDARNTNLNYPADTTVN